MTASPTILITGATDGLGRALAHDLAATGADADPARQGPRQARAHRR